MCLPGRPGDSGCPPDSWTLRPGPASRRHPADSRRRVSAEQADQRVMEAAPAPSSSSSSSPSLLREELMTKPPSGQELPGSRRSVVKDDYDDYYESNAGNGSSSNMMCNNANGDNSDNVYKERER